MDGLKRLLGHEVLRLDEARELMGHIMNGEATQAQVGALLAVFRMREPTYDELAGFAMAMRDACVPLTTKRTGLVDTCGTGGADVKTFNAGTLAGLTVAACGVPVAKHGNRSVTSKCGSADVIEALGADLEAPPDVVGRALDETGFTFLFAPAFHPAMRHAAGPRRELGVMTVFNLLGPLSNPARPGTQLMGVGQRRLLDLMPPALARLGANAIVVHGAPGMDEVSPCGATEVVVVRGGAVVKREQVTPEEVGIERVDPEKVGALDPKESADEARRILAGQEGPRADLVAMTAAGGLVASGHASSWAEGVKQAREALVSGKAQAVLDAYLAVLAEGSVDQ